MKALSAKARASISVLLLLAMLIGCEDAESRGENYTMDFGAYNHTDHSIDDFEFQFKGGQRVAGGFVGKGEGGGDICCASVPMQWTPTLTVQVRASWQDGAGVVQSISREVSLPRYASKDAGHLDIHFLRNGEVKVFVTSLATWHPDYPLQGKDVELKSVLH